MKNYRFFTPLTGAINSDYFPCVEFDINRPRLIGDQMIIWKNQSTIVRNTRRNEGLKLVPENQDLLRMKNQLLNVGNAGR